MDVPIRFSPPRVEQQRTVTSPAWVAGFDPDLAPKVFPPEAAAQGLTTGRGVAKCVVAHDGSLTNCAPGSRRSGWAGVRGGCGQTRIHDENEPVVSGRGAGRWRGRAGGGQDEPEAAVTRRRASDSAWRLPSRLHYDASLNQGREGSPFARFHLLLCRPPADISAMSRLRASLRLPTRRRPQWSHTEKGGDP